MYVIYFYQAYIKQKFEVIQKRVLCIFEMSTRLGHLSVPPCFRGVPVSRILALRVCFVDLCFSFCHFFVVHYLVCLLPFTDSDYHLGIFKLF